MPWRKIFACAILSLTVSFWSGLGGARADVQIVRQSPVVVVDGQGPITIVHTVDKGGWDDIVSMYDVPVAILSCSAQTQAACDKALDVLKSLTATEGEKWAFVLYTNGLGDTDLQPMVTVGHDPVWVTSFFSPKWNADDLKSFLGKHLKDVDISRDFVRSHCRPTDIRCH